MMTQKEAATIVLGARGDERAPQPGSFFTALVNAWTLADADNSDRLARAFPLIGVAMWIVRNEGDDALVVWGDL